jgi:hypothetical protein
METKIEFELVARGDEEVEPKFRTDSMIQNGYI